MSNRFDLEQKLLGCWSIVDDIKTIHSSLDDFKEEDLSAKAADELGCLLLGLESLYSLKFTKLFEEFEKAVIEGRV